MTPANRNSNGIPYFNVGNRDISFIRMRHHILDLSGERAFHKRSDRGTMWLIIFGWY